jgi:hypothetical protein
MFQRRSGAIQRQASSCRIHQWNLIFNLHAFPVPGESGLLMTICDGEAGVGTGVNVGEVWPVPPYPNFRISAKFFSKRAAGETL